MSWKNGEPVAEFGRTDPLQRKWSLTKRLAILHTLSAVFILTISTGILYWGLFNSLETQSIHYIRDEINVLKGMLQAPDGMAELAREIAIENEMLEFIRHYVRVLDKDNKILIETPNMDQFLPVESFPAPERVEIKPYGKRKRWVDPQGHSYFLKSLRVRTGNPGDERILQVAMDLTPGVIILSDYRQKLILVLLFGSLISGLGGWFIAIRGLEPVRQITEATRRVSAAHLDERISSTDWPRELHDLSQAFDRMLDRLHDSFLRLTQCASNMAHELRTPINNLMGEAEVLLTRERTPEDYKKVVESSLEEYERLSRIIESLLFLARAENRTAIPQKVDFEVGPEIRKICEFYDAVAEEKQVEIIQEGDGTLRADPNLFRRSINNLVSNAVKYTPPGGKITVSAHQGEDFSLQVTVSDTGCGIAEEDLPKIFDRFYRIEKTRGLDPHGMGLGLSIVKSIMDLHDGKIRVESQPDQGTSISLDFPPPVVG